MFALVLFDDSGKPIDVVRFATETRVGYPAGVQLAPGDWHTVVALAENSVLLELKAGPFDPGGAKEMAPWSPEEGTPEAQQYLRALHKLVGEW